MMKDHLFYKNGNLREFLERRNHTLVKEIEEMESNYVLNVSEVDLCKYIVSKYLLEAPYILENEIYVYDQKEETIIDRNGYHGRGVLITIAVPFNGDNTLFHYQPTTSYQYPPTGQIKENEIHLMYAKRKYTAEDLKKEYERDIEMIKKCLDWARHDIDTFNKSLETFAKEIIKQRKERLVNALGVINTLGIPIRKRDDIPKTYAVPDIQKKPKIEHPKAKTESFKSEPTLNMKEYEDILSIFQNMVIVMEKSPKAFVNMKEEDLRQHFLVQLNGQYEGQATGETFNYEGKTDILIRVDNKNVFIAECKFWRGEKKLLEAINQLLGYVSWRDTKTALLLFNRGKDFSMILQKIPEIIRSHSCYKHDVGKKGETMFRFVFHQPDDVNREIILSVMVFNIPRK